VFDRLRESLGELKKAVETLAWSLYSHIILDSPKVFVTQEKCNEELFPLSKQSISRISIPINLTLLLACSRNSQTVVL